MAARTTLTGSVMGTNAEDKMNAAERETYELLDQGSELDGTKKGTPVAPTTTIVKIEDRPLWLIQLPVANNKGIVFSEKHHNVVRKMVLKISGGLTDNLAANGEWKKKNKLYSDRNIPIEFLATYGEADKIAAFAREHYDQKEIWYFVVSDHVRLATRKKTRSARKKPRSRKQELAPQTVPFARKSVAVHEFSRQTHSGH
jgi:hypothetical protein